MKLGGLAALALLVVLAGGDERPRPSSACVGAFGAAIPRISTQLGFEVLAKGEDCPQFDEWHAEWADIRVLSDRGPFAPR